MTRVLVVGMAVVDFLFEVDEMPATPEKYIASQASVVGGGGAANAAVAIANLGGRAMLSGRIGDDTIGNMIVSDLQAHAVDCSLLQRTAGARSSYSSVLIDTRGERLIVNYRGDGLSEDVTAIDALAQDPVNRPAAVLADTRWNNGVVAAMKLARQLRVPGILDAEAPLQPEALHLASHIAFSRQGLTSLTGITDLPRSLVAAAEQFKGWLCVTDGANGVYYLDQGRSEQGSSELGSSEHSKVLHEPAPVVTVADTLGAGDVWHGAFAFALAAAGQDDGLAQHAQFTHRAQGEMRNHQAAGESGRPERQAIRFANAAASLTCSRSGGGRVSPSLTEVESFMRQQ